MTMPYDASTGPGDPGPTEAYLRWRHLQEQADAERDALLVSDAERDQVCRRLAAAFSEGRITSPELDERTSRALAARTYGDLEDVMVGLEPPAATAYRPVMPSHRPPPRSVLPRLVFWLVGILTAPFIFAGGALVLTGESVFFGLVLLMLFLPGLIALYRWAHPRT
jgi:hypothetical protein